ncbi:hypothetical protein G7085_16150 [Tessaracoccus sp. HDW20]|nr:hypothetical protein [Tessaracoccus coleopterorum]
MGIGEALELATRVLLLANGAPTVIGGLPVGIVPLGISALLILLAVPVASFAARQAAGHGGEPDDTGRLWVDGEAITLRVGGAFAGSYSVSVLILAAIMGSLSAQAVFGRWRSGSCRACGAPPAASATTRRAGGPNGSAASPARWAPPCSPSSREELCCSRSRSSPAVTGSPRSPTASVGDRPRFSC